MREQEGGFPDHTWELITRTYIVHPLLPSPPSSPTPLVSWFRGADRHLCTMSGPHLVEQASEVAPNATPTEDAAASLRAAALLTLKSKRRKLTSTADPPLIPRPFVAEHPSIELDYGSEEPSGGQPSESPAPTVKSIQDPASEHEPMNIDDDQAREEGEISDSETALPIPESKPQPPSPKVAEQVKTAAQMPPPPLKPKIEPMSPSLSFAVPRPLVFAPEPTVASTIVDENHIRPGLACKSTLPRPAARELISPVDRSDSSTVRSGQRYYPRPAWLGCISGVPRRQRPQSRDHLLRLRRTQPTPSREPRCHRIVAIYAPLRRHKGGRTFEGSSTASTDRLSTLSYGDTLRTWHQQREWFISQPL